MIIIPEIEAEAEVVQDPEYVDNWLDENGFCDYSGVGFNMPTGIITPVGIDREYFVLKGLDYDPTDPLFKIDEDKFKAIDAAYGEPDHPEVLFIDANNTGRFSRAEFLAKYKIDPLRAIIWMRRHQGVVTHPQEKREGAIETTTPQPTRRAQAKSKMVYKKLGRGRG